MQPLEDEKLLEMVDGTVTGSLAWESQARAKDPAGEQELWAGETDRNTGQTSLGVWREERSWQQKVQ